MLRWRRDSFVVGIVVCSQHCIAAAMKVQNDDIIIIDAFATQKTAPSRRGGGDCRAEFQNTKHLYPLSQCLPVGIPYSYPQRVRHPPSPHFVIMPAKAFSFDDFSMCTVSGNHQRICFLDEFPSLLSYLFCGGDWGD